MPSSEMEVAELPVPVVEIPPHSTYAANFISSGDTPHSTYAATQGGTQIGETKPQPQGTNPPGPQGTNSQLQQLHAPVNPRSVGARADAPYIRGLAPIPEDQEIYGPYTERDSEFSDDDVAPRRRRDGKKPMPDARLGDTPDPKAPTTSKEDKSFSNHRPGWSAAKKGFVPRDDPSDLLPLGDPDDPTPPFTEEIMNAHISRKFKMPTIKAYHVRIFFNVLLLQPVNDAIKCQTFPQTLSGMAQRWYSRFSLNFIGSFRDLSQAFIKQFISGRVHEKNSVSLMSIVQGAKESLRDYLNRFTKEALKVPDLDDKVAMIALRQGIRDEFFKMSLAKCPPESMLQLQDMVGKYIKVEESMRKMVVNNEPASGKKRKTDLEYIVKDKSQSLMEIEKDRDVCWPKPLKADPTKLDKSKYCRFHKDAGHETDERRKLKDEIEFLI
ncbi:hypothetical protein AgCh_013456 [Apium graveolens]